MDANNSINMDISPQEAKEQRKYLAVKRKCEEAQQTNEKLVNRIYHVKRMTKRYRKERRLLQMRLDTYRDNYRDVEVPLMSEEGELYGAPAHPASPSPQDNPKPPTATPVPSKQKSPSGATTGKAKKAKGEKKPPNAYIVFCQMQRSTIQKKFLADHKEEVSQTELTKLLSQEWNKLEPDKKKIYYEISDQRKQEAERRQALSVQTHLRQAQATTSSPFITNFMDLLKQDSSSSGPANT